MIRLLAAMSLAAVLAAPSRADASDAVFFTTLSEGAAALGARARLQKTEFLQPQPSPALEAAQRERQAVLSRVQRASMIIRVKGKEGEGTGTGVFIDPSGLAITNNHVTAGADGGMVDVEIGADLVKRKARVLAAAPGRDVAILQVIQTKGLPTDWPALTFGAQPGSGATIFAVGNPVDLGFTFTDGIVGQSVNTTENYWFDPIQLSIEINPGNSGGPLVDVNGALVGLNEAILRGGKVNGIGLAVPAATLKGALAEYRATGKLLDGITTIALAPDMSVVAVKPGSAPDQAGFKVGDTIVSFPGSDQVPDEGKVSALYRQVGHGKVGDKIPVTVVGGGDAALQTAPSADAAPKAKLPVRFSPATGVIRLQVADPASEKAAKAFFTATTKTSVEKAVIDGKLYDIEPYGNPESPSFQAKGWTPSGAREAASVIIEPYTPTPASPDDGDGN
jgi:S1-C subfamily serine protease